MDDEKMTYAKTISRITNIPDALQIREAWPGLELNDADLAAIRGVRMTASLIRCLQVCAVAWWLVDAIMTRSAGAVVVGIIIAWLLNLAKPKLPDKVSAKIVAYLAKHGNE